MYQYFPTHQKEMPNYPEISLSNPYLMSRTDDTIIDAHSYGIEVMTFAIIQLANSNEH